MGLLNKAEGINMTLLDKINREIERTDDLRNRAKQIVERFNALVKVNDECEAKITQLEGKINELDANLSNLRESKATAKKKSVNR